MNQFTVKVTGTPNAGACAKNTSSACVQPTGRVEMNVTVFGSGSGIVGWLNSLQVCDSDNMESQTGNSAEDAGIPIGGYYMTAFNHVEVAGGIPKKRLV